MLLDIDNQKEEYRYKTKTLASEFKEVSAGDFYRDIFPIGSFERAGHKEDRKPNAIIVDISEKKSVNHIVFDDLGAFSECKGIKFAISNAIAYSGRNRTKKNAYSLYGFIIDLDYVTDYTLGDLIFQMEGGIIPMASYLVNSGTGVHVYYVFNEPIPLFDWLVDSLNKLKTALTDIVWNQYTSVERKKQFQSIYQGFRVVGSQSKLGIDYPVRAYKTGKKVSIEYLNGYVPLESQVNFDEIEHISLEEAKELYPNWYEKRIVKGEKRGFFHYNRGMYDRWLEKIEEGTFDGNRYHCICVLFANAIKCDISKEEVMKDAIELLPILEKKTKYPKNHFTLSDVLDASKYYNEGSHLLRASTIRLKTAIDLPIDKRNGRTKMEHLQAEYWKDEKGRPNINPCRQNRDLVLKFMRDNGEIKGRPIGSGTKEKVVNDYINKNPNKTVTEIARELNLSRTTVYKYIKKRG